MIDIMKQGLGLRTPQQERFGNSQELKSFGGELGTRTPDPLRVMHDDFSVFRTMIR